MSDVLKKQQEPSSIEDQHFPSLYQSADRASLSAQRRYLWLQKCHIGCLIFGSVGAALATIVPVSAVKWAYIILAIILVIGVVLTWVSRVLRDDKVWFDCRAIAESTKTATWRFMMKAAPFKEDSTAEQSFIERLKEIRKARPSSPKDLAHSLDPDAQALSKFMSDMRRKSLDERRNVYFESRLLDQKIWYSNKATFNSRKENCWFWTVVILQVLAVILAIIWAASTSSLPVNVVPLLMTCAASAIAWSQMKRYGELTQSYSLAAQELGEQEAIASNITKEDDLLALMEQVEETISREHTMWCARRDVVINPK